VPLDVAVGLLATGADVGEASAELPDRLAEALAAELVAVVAERALEPPVAFKRLLCGLLGAPVSCKLGG
jgi:hypothetical protein